MAKINKDGYAEISFTNSLIMNFLKIKTKELNLPCLQRKWNKIDETFISGKVLARDRKQIVENCLVNGDSVTTIAAKIGLSYGGAYRIVRQFKNAINYRQREQIIKEYLAKGHNIIEIAKLVGITTSGVYKIINRLGL